MYGAKVWISSRRLTGGKRSYHLRWRDPDTGGMMSKRAAGNDRKAAMHEAGRLEADLSRGAVHRLSQIG